MIVKSESPAQAQAQLENEIVSHSDFFAVILQIAKLDLKLYIVYTIQIGRRYKIYFQYCPCAGCHTHSIHLI
jgi:hypothetical protein